MQNTNNTLPTATVTVRAVPRPWGEATVTIDGTTHRVYRALIRLGNRGDEWDNVATGTGDHFHPDHMAEHYRWCAGKALPADFGARVLAALDRSQASAGAVR